MTVTRPGPGHDGHIGGAVSAAPLSRPRWARDQLLHLLRAELGQLMTEHEAIGERIAEKKYQILLLAEMAVPEEERETPGTSVDGPDGPGGGAVRPPISREQLTQSVRRIGLEQRTLNCLLNGGITTLQELAERTDEELLLVRNFGRRCLADVTGVLRSFGLTTGMVFPAGPDGPVGIAGTDTGGSTPDGSAPVVLRDWLSGHAAAELRAIEEAHAECPRLAAGRLIGMADTKLTEVTERWRMSHEEASDYLTGLIGLEARLLAGESVSPLEELALALARGDDRDRAMTVRRFGLDGSPPETLDAIGVAHSVTRERVRQRLRRFQENVLVSRPPLPITEAVMRALDPARPYALEEWFGAVPASLRPQRPEHLMVLQWVMEWGWLPPFSVHEDGTLLLVSGRPDDSSGLATLVRDLRARLRPHMAMGAVMPARIADGDVGLETRLRSLLRADTRWSAVDDDWFILRSTRRTLLGRRARYVLALLGPLPLVDLRHGLRRNLRRKSLAGAMMLPPPAILRRVLRRAGCVVPRGEGVVSLRTPPTVPEGSNTDLAVHGAFAEGREAITVQELDDAVCAAGLSIASARFASSCSPILFREQHGIYSLLGRRASEEAIDAARARLDPFAGVRRVDSSSAPVFSHQADVTPTLRDRMRGALIGLAVGDAVGTTVEFSPPGTFVPVTDMVGGGPFGLEPGQWTDDTSMALCLAESLIERQRFDPRDQMERYLRWRDEGHLSSNGRCFDIGGTVSGALRAFEATGEPFSGPTGEMTAGNGSLMRLAPVPVFYSGTPEDAIELAGESSRTTHGARVAVDACRYLAALIIAALRGMPKEQLLGGIVSPGESYWDERPLHPVIGAIAEGSFRNADPPEIRGTGYAAQSLEAALWAFHHARDFREGCLLAANLGDDADTTAAIYGQLAGAYFGESGIPEEWRSRLAHRSLLDRYADALCRPPATPARAVGPGPAPEVVRN